MWAQFINVVLGLAVMFTPSIFHFNKMAANNNHIIGPLVITYGVISIWEINRNARLFNVLTGGWLVVSPFVFGFGSIAFVTDIVCGLAIIGFSLIKGNINHKYGGGWRSLFQKHPSHVQAVKSASS